MKSIQLGTYLLNYFTQLNPTVHALFYFLLAYQRQIFAKMTRYWQKIMTYRQQTTKDFFRFLHRLINLLIKAESLAYSWLCTHYKISSCSQHRRWIGFQHLISFRFCFLRKGETTSISSSSIPFQLVVPDRYQEEQHK